MNPFGPMSREDFLALANAPFGAALDAIRKHDPLYGRKPGEKIRWCVTLKREVPEIGTAYVTATTEEEATQLADKLTEAEIDWEVANYCYHDALGTIDKIEPDKHQPAPNVDPFPF